jgi:osmotically-inducible protein OsmY
MIARLLLLGSLSLMVTGCGGILASLETDTIEDNPLERTFPQQLQDESIETKARVNLGADNDAYDDAHLVIVSFNGFVLLAGQVPSEALKARAIEVVRRVAGVRRIYNELEIGPPSSAGTRANDTWLTTKVKARLMSTSSIEGGRVKVVTENGVVYLMGLTTREEADRISTAAAGISGVERVVRLFELVS